MKIEIISATENPMDVIAVAAGTSYGKSNPKHSRAAHCFKNGHMSVFENAVVTFRVEGISRACSHQLVRHRMASYCQKSQRYTKIDTSSDDWYVVPKCFDGMNDDGADVFFETAMEDAAMAYNKAIEHGIKPEDARYLLPEATKTDITCTFNVRSLFNFLDLRTDSHAQWEIRNLANMLVNEIRQINDQWAEVINLWSSDSKC